MQSRLLSELAVVQTGYSFRNGVEPVESGVFVLQIKDVSLDGFININSMNRIINNNYGRNCMLQSGDLVFRARGQVSTAGVIQGVSEPVVLAGPLLKISITSKLVLPEFLAWYINSDEGQAYLNSVADGSTVKMVSKKSLSEMLVPLPALAVQKQIIEVADLAYREKKIMEELIIKRDEYIKLRLVRRIKED